jgi:protein arginine N-methyltransferase 1
MYSLRLFAAMFHDRVRHDAYAEAMRRVINPDSVVLDIGTGTGFYAQLACQLGARKVYALETNPLVRVGRQIAAANGFGDRIEFIERLSTEVTLPERADVIVCDLRGNSPFLRQNLPSVADARDRHLKPGGVLMPRRDRIFAALATNEKAFAGGAGAWLHNPLGLDMSAAASLIANTTTTDSVESGQFLTDPQCIHEIDYWALESEYGMDATLEAPTTRAGIAHGISMWFEASPLEGITYVTGPGDVSERSTVYGMSFLPLARPVEVQSGDSASARLRAVYSNDVYTWAWSTTIRGEGGEIRAKLMQSTLDSEPLSREVIRRRSAEFTISPNQMLEVDRRVLASLAEGAPLGVIAGELAGTAPDRFATSRDALAYVADLAERYIQ